ncbi:hypothetical protein TNCV_775291 [Trichonephila clavipes]|nr:hypothetical protein TNCV_775291 [Trichonephila clavipes]
MLVRLPRAPVLSGGPRRKTQLFSGTLYMAASSKIPPYQSKGSQKFKTLLQVPVFLGSSPLCHHTKSENPSDTTSFQLVLPDGHGYELVSSVRALVPQKFSVEEELMHVKHVEVKSPHVGVMWKFGRGVISSGPPAVLTGEGVKMPRIFEAVREIYRNIFGIASFEKVDRFRSEIQLAGHPVRVLKKKGAKFNWSTEAQDSLDKIKRTLTEAPVLQLPNFTEQFNLFTKC